MSLTSYKEELITKLHTLRKEKSLRRVAAEMHLHQNTLLNFLYSSHYNDTTMRKVEAWCEAQERMHNGA